MNAETPAPPGAPEESVTVPAAVLPVGQPAPRARDLDEFCGAEIITEYGIAVTCTGIPHGGDMWHAAYADGQVIVTWPSGQAGAVASRPALPYRGKRSRATTTREPLHTLATHDSAALLQPDDPEVAECRLRMLKPREHLRAQRIPDAYIVTGNQGEQTMQAGNAVSSNVAHWLGAQVAAVL